MDFLGGSRTSSPSTSDVLFPPSLLIDLPVGGIASFYIFASGK
jgi:hypothetical protein